MKYTDDKKSIFIIPYLKDMSETEETKGRKQKNKRKLINKKRN